MKKTLALVLSVFLAAALAGCGKKVPLPDDQKAFAGKWVADDGTYVTIYLDGGGDLKGSNTSITGGSTVIAGDSLTINGTITAKLMSRHWLITNGDGEVEEVRGAGVIGQQPG